MATRAEQIKNEYLEAVIVDRLEQRAMERENKRFRALYIIFAVVTAIGVGVFLNQISISADDAVEKRLGEVIEEVEAAKLYTSLLNIATRLDVKDSFTNNDRDTVVHILHQIKDNEKVRSDSSFPTTLENIIDAFAVSNNEPLVTEICDHYERECFSKSGIIETILRTYGVHMIGTPDAETALAATNRRMFDHAFERAPNALDGIGQAYRIMWLYKYKTAQDVKRYLSQIDDMQDRSKQNFLSTLNGVRSFGEGEIRNPVYNEAAEVAARFIDEYNADLMAFVPEGEGD